ncbi:hypothetical protein CR513_39922, partial [Mucuna pruriens]
MMTLNRLRVVGLSVSTWHLCMKYLIRKEVGVVKVDQRIAHRCSKESLKVGHKTSNHDRASGS